MEEALGLFDRVEKHGCSRDQYMYGRLIHALLRRDQFEDAVAKLTEMKDAGIPQSTHMYSLPNTPYIVFFMCFMPFFAFFDVLYVIDCIFFCVICHQKWHRAHQKIQPIT
jgi:pentatricopeptide repeat protein